MQELTQSRLKELLHYDADTGVFTRKIKTNKNQIIGQRMGTSRPDARRVISFKIGNSNIRIFEHRIAWFYMTGEWPKNQIDHKDRNGASSTRKLNHR